MGATTKARIKVYVYCLVAIPAIIAYFILGGDDKIKLKMDINRFWIHLRGERPKSHFSAFYYLICGIREFRNVFYMRLGYSSMLISWLMPEMVEFSFATPSRFVGGGVFVQHGWTCVVDAETVGENLWINQNVTIGHQGKGHPTIGDNVRIGSGAVLLGDIKIGDNVNIGANAIVVNDVPSNCTVCSPKAIIVKRFEGLNQNGIQGEKANGLLHSILPRITQRNFGGGKLLIIKQLGNCYSKTA